MFLLKLLSMRVVMFCCWFLGDTVGRSFLSFLLRSSIGDTVGRLGFDQPSQTSISEYIYERLELSSTDVCKQVDLDS